jgi:hypothetical protein
MREIHFLISYNTETKKWRAEDETLNAHFQDGLVYEYTNPETGEGVWRFTDSENPAEVDLDYELSEKIGEFLRQANGEG